MIKEQTRLRKEISWMIFINFKTYPQGTGQQAVELAKICEQVGKSSGVEIIPVIQAVDLYRVAQAVQIPVWVQHVDWQSQGQHTGLVNLEAVVEAGASGTLLNHAEHRIPPGTVKQVIKRIENFKVMVCARTLGQAERLAKLKPDFLAYEPPELIGGEVAVSEAEPGVIKRIVEKVPGVPIIVGAGVKSGKDVKKSIELGAVGVLVSSGVVLAKDPEEALEDLTNGFK